MPAKPKSIDEYLAAVEPAQREALEKLRRTIRAAAPHAEECISYGLPTFKQDGMLVSFGAWARHCALYGLSGTLTAQFHDQLQDYDTSKGTIRFQPEKPLPVTFVRKLIKARLAENAQRRKRRKKA